MAEVLRKTWSLDSVITYVGFGNFANWVRNTRTYSIDYKYFELDPDHFSVLLVFKQSDKTKRKDFGKNSKFEIT